MEFTPLFVLVGIVVTSGFIAYVCDIVGKKLGKKRLSVLGMRPRHTATTGTVLVGALISITSICLMIVGSKDARDWMIRGGTAMRDLGIAQGDLKAIRSELDSDQGQLRAVQAELASQHELSKQAQVNLAVQVKRSRDEEKKIESEQTTINSLGNEKKLLLAEKATYARQIAIDHQELKKTDAAVKFVTAQRNGLEKQYNEFQRDSDKKLVQNRNEIARQTESLNRLNGTVADLERKSSGLKTDLKQKQVDLAMATQELSDKNTQLVAEQSKLDQVAKDAQKYFDSITYPSRFGRMIYRYQQEVARIDLPPNMTEEQATEAVSTLLDRARIYASQRGAGASNGADVAHLVDLSGGPTGDERLKQIVVELIKDPQPIVLMASASANTFEKEPVPLDLIKYPNPLVYTKGQVVAESKIDGSESRDDVRKQLEQFFAVNLTQKTRKDNMIPDPRDQAAFGTVSDDQLYGLMETVKLKGRQVRLVAKAQTDTHAADPLKLDFEVQ